MKLLIQITKHIIKETSEEDQKVKRLKHQQYNSQDELVDSNNKAYNVNTFLFKKFQ